MRLIELRKNNNDCDSGVILSPEISGRHVAPATERMFAGAKVSRLDSDLGETGEVNKNIYENQVVLRGRARQLAMDNVHIIKYLSMATQETLGPKGLKLSINGPDEKINKIIEELYEDWSDDCCTSGDMTLLEFEELAVQTRHRDGEFFSRIVENFSDNKYKFALFPFDADRLELGYDRMPKNDGSYIRNSIEYNQWGRPIAYHVLTRHPGDTIMRWPDNGFRMRMPAKEIAHYFELLRPGQGRGITSLHAAITTAKHLNAYVKATIVAARVISSKFAAITSKEADPHNANLGIPDANKGEILHKVEAGRIIRLRPGESMEVFDPKQPSGQFAPFITSILQGMSGGLGISYASLSGDLSKTSFASGRLAALETRDYWTLKRTKFIKRLKLRIFKQWLPWAYLTQDVLFNSIKSANELNIYMNSVQVHDKPVTWIDPGVTSKVIERNLRTGITTLKSELAKQGIDYTPHVDQLFKEAVDMAKLRAINNTNNGGDKENENRAKIIKNQSEVG